MLTSSPNRRQAPWRRGSARPDETSPICQDDAAISAGASPDLDPAIKAISREPSESATSARYAGPARKARGSRRRLRRWRSLCPVFGRISDKCPRSGQNPDSRPVVDRAAEDGGTGAQRYAIVVGNRHRRAGGDARIVALLHWREARGTDVAASGRHADSIRSWNARARGRARG